MLPSKPYLVAGFMLAQSLLAEGSPLEAGAAESALESLQRPLVLESPGGTAAAPLDEAAERERLALLPPVRLPVQEASLGSAVNLIAAAAGMNFIAPPPERFPETVSLFATANPWSLLQMLAERYSFTLRYSGGVWLFDRVPADEPVALVHKLRHGNLDTHDAGQNSLTGVGSAAASGGGVFTARSARLVEDLGRLLGEAARIVHVPENNSLLVVATRAQHEQVRLYLAGVDKPARQVRIEARFVETGHDPRFVIGLDPTNLQPNLSLGELAAQWNLNDLGAARLPTEAVFSAETLSLQLRALKSDDSSRVINQPSVTTSENREVYLSVGTEEPFASASLTATGAGDALAGATQTAVAFRRIGTSINVVPTVFETTDGRLAVRLAVQVEVGSLAGFRRVGDSDVPRVQSQRYLFTVVVPDGQTLAFGGLSGAGEQSGERALPLLGDLPLAGALFRSRSRSSSQRNLVAYITPRVLTGGELAKEPPSVSADDLSEAVRITDRPGRLLQPPAVETDSGGRG